MNLFNNENVHITLLNIENVDVKHKNFTSVKGDGCNLDMYGTNQFDVVYSNSVIEHLFSFENQKKMANEAQRVGKHFYVQTPHFYFPIEPHWLFPLFKFLPFKT